MSYEGFTQYLCKNNHYSTLDAYEDYGFEWNEGEGDWKCPGCGESAVWWNMCNVTNGSYYEEERIDGYVELELVKEMPTCECHCGHVHTTGPAVYKLPPKDVGHHVTTKSGVTK